ncbi:hypothetical protein UFOVP1382_213 [uncultured Caudovirales phage]|uniref:Uncharacterized protein n=1 Tax=uncultured Caudovirales phage TaxID=2100421 RepID=A0A6J5S5F0_9CAUD|nr:hypothetical protein UFOVP1382_213 [uncultured Caudovirales phage]
MALPVVPCIVVKAATLSPLSPPFAGAHWRIGGVTVGAGDAVLVMGQTNTLSNGVFIVQTGRWVRHEQIDGLARINAKHYVYIEGGSYAGLAVLGEMRRYIVFAKTTRASFVAAPLASLHQAYTHADRAHVATLVAAGALVDMEQTGRIAGPAPKAAPIVTGGVEALDAFDSLTFDLGAPDGDKSVTSVVALGSPTGAPAPAAVSPHAARPVVAPTADPDGLGWLDDIGADS